MFRKPLRTPYRRQVKDIPLTEKSDRSSSAALTRYAFLEKRKDAWQQVLQEDAAAAKAESQKTAKLRALRLAKEEAERAAPKAPVVKKTKRS